MVATATVLLPSPRAPMGPVGLRTRVSIDRGRSRGGRRQARTRVRARSRLGRSPLPAPPFCECPRGYELFGGAG